MEYMDVTILQVDINFVLHTYTSNKNKNLKQNFMWQNTSTCSKGSFKMGETFPCYSCDINLISLYMQNSGKLTIKNSPN